MGLEISPPGAVGGSVWMGPGGRGLWRISFPGRWLGGLPKRGAGWEGTWAWDWRALREVRGWIWVGGSSQPSRQVERDCALGSVGVSWPVCRFRRVPRWARAAVESRDAWCLSAALSWLLCTLFWFPASGVSQLSCWLLGAAKAAGCEGVVTECSVRDALGRVGLNKLPGLDGLPSEVCLGLLF